MIRHGASVAGAAANIDVVTTTVQRLAKQDTISFTVIVEHGLTHGKRLTRLFVIYVFSSLQVAVEGIHIRRVKDHVVTVVERVERVLSEHDVQTLTRLHIDGIAREPTETSLLTSDGICLRITVLVNRRAFLRFMSDVMINRTVEFLGHHVVFFLGGTTGLQNEGACPLAFVGSQNHIDGIEIGHRLVVTCTSRHRTKV